jgi:hypothetical protein
MTELIWIGNTLYPRWVVFSALALVILAAYTLVCAILALIEGRT